MLCLTFMEAGHNRHDAVLYTYEHAAAHFSRHVPDSIGFIMSEDE